ncbi:SIMPL domain-containing protein [Paenibacillus sp. sptzw28]|uniref:SIMPL domain-containing protein n=1 Tax=Paenibacillus sp. sptzw28 TaxID=715179 RepID=UPI001C6EAACD|nr:SIMPL domain-containing protein [Paenibacillus sp. sptzw28]QYR21541.1 SIMPL domain-containing protein [Paenibacillus sp. sptzw28]
MFMRWVRRSSSETGAGRERAPRRRSILLLAGALAVAVGIGTAIGAGGGKTDVYALDTSGAVEKGIITVTGSGDLQAAPDVAYVNVGIDTRAATAKEAQAKNANQFAALKKVLFGYNKLAEKDVKTTGFYVQPEYRYNNNDGTSKLTGYVATHSVQITTRNLDGIGQLLDGLSAAGANRVDGVQFDTEKQDQYELQVLEKAVANAKAKAEALAKAAGKQLNGVVNISQNNVSSTPIFNRGEYAAADKAAESAPTTVQTGEITVSANITVVFAMQ